MQVIWAGGKWQNFLLWDWTAQITPNLARRARGFLVGVIAVADGKGKFDTSGIRPDLAP
jgi:hypothetical protein